MMRVPDSTPNTDFLVMGWLLMQKVRVRRTVPRVLRIYVAGEMKPRLITQYVLERV
jgi:hypothetical protein